MISLIPFEKRFNSLFDDLLDVSPFQSTFNVSTENDKYTITLDVPGMTKEDITVEARDGLLIVKGLKESKNLKRSVHQRLTVPKGTDLEKIEATVEHGVLTISLPKSVAQLARTIQIK